MENLNKNWMLILLVAVIFGTLGFLLGRVTGPHHPPRMMWVEKEAHGMNDSTQLEIKVEMKDGEGTVFEKTDTIVKDGKEIIIKEIKKVK